MFWYQLHLVTISLTEAWMMELELRFQLEGGVPGAKPQNQMPLNVQSALLINLIQPNHVGVEKKPNKPQTKKPP